MATGQKSVFQMFGYILAVSLVGNLSFAGANQNVSTTYRPEKGIIEKTSEGFGGPLENLALYELFLPWGYVPLNKTRTLVRKIGVFPGSSGETFSAVSYQLPPEVQVTVDSCSNAAWGPSSPDFCEIDFLVTPKQLGPIDFTFSYQAIISDGSGSTKQDTFSTANEVIVKAPCPKCEAQAAGGSTIGLDNMSLAETVPLPGNPFEMVYTTAYAPTFVSLSGSAPSVPFFNNEGWTFSNHHYFNGIENNLFFGTGHAQSVDALPQVDGTVLVVSPNGDEVYKFSAAGQHLATLSFLTGATIYTFGYDSNSHLTSIQDGFGNTSTIQRDAKGRMTSVTSPHGQVTSFTLSPNYLIGSVTLPSGATYKLTYGNTGLLSAFQKPGGQKSVHGYDALGKVSVDFGFGGDKFKIATTCSATAASSTLSTALNRQTALTSTYDSAGNYTRVSTAPTGLATTHGETNDPGVTPVISTSNQLQTSGVTLAPDARFGFSYNRDLASSLTLEGVTSTTTHLQNIVSPSSNPFSYGSISDTYTTSGRTVTAAFTPAASGSTTSTSTTTSAAGAVVTRLLDLHERPVSVTTGSDTAVAISYSSTGKVSLTSQGTKNQTTYSYNTRDQLQSAVNQRGEATDYAYDLDGRVTQITLPGSRTISKTYDPNGNLTSITTPGGATHNFILNKMELTSQYQPPTVTGVSQPATSYTYNLDKQLTGITRPDGQAIQYVYNATTGLLSSVSTALGNYSYAYDPTHPTMVQSITTPAGNQDVYTYRGSIPASLTQKNSSGTTLGAVSYGFDTDHRITSVISQGASSASAVSTPITLNADGLPTQVGYLYITYSYPSGRVLGQNIGVVSDARTYDSYGYLQSYTATSTVSGVATQLYTYTLTRDSMSRISGMTETILGTTNTFVYAYDSAARLTGVTKNGTAIVANTYDSNGNRVSGSLNGTSFTGTFDSQDRLQSFNGLSYTFNANGDLTGSTTGAVSNSYSYDVFGALSSATLGSGTGLTYLNDGSHRRIGRTAVSGAASTYEGYLYDPKGRLIAEIDASGNLLKGYGFGLSDTSPEYTVNAAGVFAIIKDNLGSPRLIVNATTGAVAEHIDYGPYGDVQLDTAPGITPFGFAGGLYDSATRLVRFGARDYDPATGRWTTKDPIRFGGGDTNLYGYVLNDPVNFVDPDGKAVQDSGEDSGHLSNDDYDRLLDLEKRRQHMIDVLMGKFKCPAEDKSKEIEVKQKTDAPGGLRGQNGDANSASM